MVMQKTLPDANTVTPAVGVLSRGSMLKRMEKLEDELSDSLNYTGNARWMIPYADLMTVLMGMLLVLIAITNMGQKSLTQYTAHIKNNLMQKEQVINSQAEEMTQLALQLEALQETLETAVLIPELTEELDETLLKDGDSELLVDTQLSKGININQEARGLVITMQDQVLFSAGSAELNDTAKQTLDKIATIIKKADTPIRVEGHTDDTPISTKEFPSNWELSTERATGIVRYFIQKHGFSPAQLSAAGYGEFKPVASNSSIQGKQKNRRVDIVVLSHQAQQQEPNIKALMTETIPKT